MIKTKRILSHLRRAADIYKMINCGDKIAVGVSGGKDSLTLLYGLSQLRLFYPEKFDIIAITIDCGFDNIDFTGIKILCEKLNIDYHIIPVNIKQIVFDFRKEKNPCSLCSKLRHGALNKTAKNLGCNKVALAHHLDDSAETFMLNLIYESRLSSFSPVTYLDRSELTLIRPLIYAPEKEIKSFVKNINLPVVKNSCPADKKTRREDVKILLGDLSRKYRNFKYNIFSAIEKSEIDGYINPERRKGTK
ncbi:MAG: tRNA 2-thiocytidine biosynthesis TtcA family protein [Oscillospiraceae bacterium]|nr:tRNA 2-thiocytidine biosynthesis TtcA family protein [Oscillospiraceae bacterium]